MEIRSEAGVKSPTHFGSVERPLFGFYHPPAAGRWRGVGVVLCNPIGTDQTRSERTYRHLAERLAQAGFACLRFDLYGTGDSGGDGVTASAVAGWSDDVGAAVEHLRARSGARTIALAGLRLGATLALVHAAERGGIDSLVLWSPCVSGAAFVAETTKLHKLYARIEPRMAGAPPARADGEEALGLFLAKGSLEQLAKLDALKLTGPLALRALVIDGGNLPGRDELIAHLQKLGTAPELQLHPGHKFLVAVSHHSKVPDEALASIVGWLAADHPREVEAAPVATLRDAPAPAGERAIVFGDSGSLFGIVSLGAAGSTERPAIILCNAGCVNRSGPHRLYVQLARRWAQLGHDVLRFDLSGIGDSPVAPGAQENLTYPPAAMRDLAAAIDALGARRVIIAGLCSGADYAFQLAASDPRVAQAWLMNPRTFCVLALAAVESGAPPSVSVDEVPLALRKIAERGVETLLLVSRGDPGVAYVDAHASAAMAALGTLRAFQRVDLEGADHSFTPVAIQERVSDLLTERLTRLR